MLKLINQNSNVGTNVADKVGSTELLASYRQLARELKDRRVKSIVLLAILPVVGGRTEYRKSRRMAINSQLQRMCEMEEVGFVDVWCRCVGTQDLYLRDGLHLTKYGAAVLCDEFLKVMSNSTPFLGYHMMV